MTNETVLILGVPVDNITMPEAVQRIMTMTDTFAHDRRPKMVATVNVDFLVNTLTWFSSRSRHSELLKILRCANLVTADGMPIVWVSRLLGAPLKELVTGAELVPMIARESARQGKSIYLLGGKSEVGRRAAEVLLQRYPGLTIAGADAPFVTIVEEGLADKKARDAAIVDRINRSGADILLVAFGNAKQEVWFDRNRSDLRVPVTVGVSSTFDFITGSVTRAPLWMQKAGLEWIFRITQNPKRLWKHYIAVFFKFSLMILPSVIYFYYRRFQFKGAASGQPAAETKSELRSQGPQAIQLIHIVDALDATAARDLSTDLTVSPLLSEITVLDFSQVTLIDSAGIGFLLKLWNQARDEGALIYLTGIQAPVERVLRLSHIHDLFADHICDTPDKVFERLHEDRKRPAFHYLFMDSSSYVLLRLYGTLDAAQTPFLNMEAILGVLENRHCIIDLEHLSFVDSSGLMVLLKIYRHVTCHGHTCRLSGAADNVRQMLRITRLDRLMPPATDVDSAVRLLQQTNSLEPLRPPHLNPTESIEV